MIRFQLLGPVELWSGDTRIDLGPARQRTVLAALLIEPEQPISIGTLVDRVWADAPPDGVRNVVYTYVTRLRRALAAAGEPAVRLYRDDGGYRLSVPREQVDLHRFGALVRRARAVGLDDPRRGTLLREALRLWRGQALAGLDTEWVTRVRGTLQQQRNEALAAWADAESRAGRGGAVIQELRDALVQEPMAELLHEQLVRALHRTGQRAEALSQFERARRVIAEELGADPGPGLQDAYRLILAQQPAPRTRPPAPVTRGGPDLLPPGLPDFAARDAELAELCGRLADIAGEDGGGGARRGASAPVMVLTGGAGAGKTALAVQAAHRAAAHFPHGRLYLNLRGSDGPPVPPAVALTRLLRALGEDAPAAEPRGVDELAEAYRARLAELRVLVVLDDAADDGQVTPLLPGGPRCATLVTSRFLSCGPPGGTVCRVGGLSPAGAVELLARMAGRERVGAEEDAARRLAELSDGLPLALRALASRLVARPHWSLSRLAGRLADEDRRLAELSYGSLDVRDRLAATYRTLTPAAGAAFRLLGARPCGDGEGVTAGEVLPGLPPAEAEEVLEQLVDAHLLRAAADDPDGAIRYRLDALPRLFARFLAVDGASPTRIVPHSSLTRPRQDTFKNSDHNAPAA